MSQVMYFDAYGGTEGLRLADEQVRDPHDGEIRVRNQVIGVNPADVKALAGRFGRAELPGVLGFEAAGVVDAIGPDVTEFATGDAVLWHGTGAQRELAIVAVSHARHKPESVGFDQAAVLPVAAATAFSAAAQASVGPDDVVLIHGGSGGVGSAAIQVVKALGARAIASSSAQNAGYVQFLGAEPVAHGPGLVDQVRSLPTDLSDVSAVLDFVGTPETIAQSVELLGGVPGVRLIPGALPKAVTTAGSSMSDAAGLSRVVDAKGALDEVLALAEAGMLHTEITGRFPLAQAAEALDLVGQGHTRGKIVLEV